MNERIRDIAERAETKEIGYYFFDREKFAELIVREWVEIIDDTHQSQGINIFIIDKIKQHFGVDR